MDENVAKAVKATDDEFEVMLEGLSPLARAEYIELTAFPMGRQQWQTIRARLVELEAEVESLREQVLRAHRDLMDERYSVPAHLSENSRG